MEKTQVNPKRVLLINSDPFELATLSASLRLHGVNVVGEASNIFLAENLHRSLQPEVVLAELQSPGEEAIGFINKARKINPKLGIVIMTVCPDLRLIGLQEKISHTEAKLFSSELYPIYQFSPPLLLLA